MKSNKQLALEKLLRYMAVQVLRRHKPQVVAVTGSVGKTTTKDMIATMLEKFFIVRKNIKNYNNEIGVPLTIIGVESGGQSLVKWIGVFMKWLKVMLLPGGYPQIVVLEMGADKPGDIQYLCDFVPVNVGVITGIGISHLEHFKTRRDVAREKTKLVKAVPVGGLAVLNYDNQECRNAAKTLKANVIGYGLEDEVPMRASDITFGYGSIDDDPAGQGSSQGTLFKLNYQGKIIPVRLDHCIGRPQVYAALAALSVGVHYNLNLVEAAQAIQDFTPSPGRMNVIEGVYGSTIIDDNYNSAPESVKAAMEAVVHLSAARKIVALGDMLELGDESVKAHIQIGKLVAESQIDLFVTVGKRMHAAAQEFARVTGRADLVMEFDSPADAGSFIKDVVKHGDMVLVKGSQGMRMEKITEQIMAEPGRKEELLPRQDSRWLEKEYEMP